MRSAALRVVPLLVAAFVAACGGGGGDHGPDVSPPDDSVAVLHDNTPY